MIFSVTLRERSEVAGSMLISPAAWILRLRAE